MLKGFAQVIYYKYFLHVKWQPGYNPFTRIYSIKHKGIKISFHQCPFYDFEHDDLDYLRHIELSKPVVLIDAGSFIGTLALFIATASPDSRVYALEPDPQNYRQLQENISLNHLQNVIPLQVGLWKESGNVRFSSGKGEMSQVSSSGRKIKVISLDDLTKKIKRKISHVKMDIEGAEIEAIQGASQLIKSKHPTLIIASYHLRDGHPTHLWLEKNLRKHYPKVRTSGGGQTLTVCSLS